MSISIEVITAEEAQKVIDNEESQFSDVKGLMIEPNRATKTLSALANSDGGDVYIGIDELLPSKHRQWRGFSDQEAANGFLQHFEGLFPLSQDCHYEFLKCSAHPGLILHIQILKTKRIVKASNGLAYIRKGAQNLPLDTPDAIKRLEFAKGLSSFEVEIINTSMDVITESEPIRAFIKEVVPRQEPETWLKKQRLIDSERPTVAGVILFADEPQATLPKRCGIKIYRYKTTNKEGFRAALAFTPITVEGWLYKQIQGAVEQTIAEVEKIPRMGEDQLESIRYPIEAIHEIITNAVLHRDYSIADDVHIRIFDNRVEIENPGRLPAHITPQNILRERFARNGSIVRILNKFPDAPNKDVGEGLNTAFAAMNELGLKNPVIQERENSVLVILRHEKLASPEEAIMDYLEPEGTWINNRIARQVTHVVEDHRVRAIFHRMMSKGMIQKLPGSITSNTKYEKARPAEPLSPTTNEIPDQLF